MMKKITSYLAIISLLLITFSCGGGGSGSSKGISSVTISASFKNFTTLSNTSLNAAASTLTSIHYTVTGSGMEKMTGSVPVIGNLVEFILDVPNGPRRHFLIEALDVNNQVKYIGEANRDLDGTPVTIEIILLPTGLTSSECLNAVNQDNIIEARDICVAAADSYGSIVSNDADVARFFAALSRVAALWYDQTSDGNPNNGLNTFGDILDAFGCSVSGRDPERFDITWPDILPANSPTGGELQTFIRYIIRPEIEGAIENLGNVSQSFNISWIEPIDETTVESDFGDVLAAKALFKSLLASIIIENSYNLDGDFDLMDYHIEQFLADNPDFLKLTSSSELSGAKNYLIGASNDALSAIDWIQAETDDQNNDFVNLLDIEPATINDAKEYINEFKTSLTGPVNLYEDDEKTQLNGTLNLTNFFVGMDLRSLLPAYSGDDPGFFPDPTFNGIWTNYPQGANGDPNLDLDEDGSPDVIDW
jgi:hypothetical protein